MASMDVTRGDDFSAVFTVSDEVGPTNLTGYALSATVSWIGGEFGAAVSPVNLSLGRARVSMDEIQTASLPLGNVASLKFKWVSPSGDTTSIRVELEVKV